jgi:hypothetical protein
VKRSFNISARRGSPTPPGAPPSARRGSPDPAGVPDTDRSHAGAPTSARRGSPDPAGGATQRSARVSRPRRGTGPTGLARSPQTPASKVFVLAKLIPKEGDLSVMDLGPGRETRAQRGALGRGRETRAPRGAWGGVVRPAPSAGFGAVS